MKQIRIMNNNETEKEINDFLQLVDGDVKNYNPIVIEYENSETYWIIKKIRSIIAAGFEIEGFIQNRTETCSGLVYSKGSKLKELMNARFKVYELEDKTLFAELLKFKFTNKDIVSFYVGGKSSNIKKVTLANMLDTATNYAIESYKHVLKNTEYSDIEKIKYCWGL